MKKLGYEVELLYDFAEDGEDYTPFIDHAWQMEDGTRSTVMLERINGIVYVYKINNIE